MAHIKLNHLYGQYGQALLQGGIRTCITFAGCTPASHFVKDATGANQLLTSRFL
ncbi:hypothetical protein E4U56_004714 [Claviceps arundinis]|uniref:Uncharacterized protein n=1 Tax=Claviceps arundinis TaxID=1623583 RepID=A0A9P7MXJ8_9HYPO|nr:hypothetical protein E4U56_004714 [Claviceps arundinis]